MSKSEELLIVESDYIGSAERTCLSAPQRLESSKQVETVFRTNKHTHTHTDSHACIHMSVLYMYILELDRLHNYPIVPMPMVLIVRTADGEADCECYRLSVEMSCL